MEARTPAQQPQQPKSNRPLPTNQNAQTRGSNRRNTVRVEPRNLQRNPNPNISRPVKAAGHDLSKPIQQITSEREQSNSKREPPAPAPTIAPNNEGYLVAKRFCDVAIENASHDLLAWQTQRIEILSAELEVKLKELEARTIELKKAEEKQTRLNAQLNTNFITIISRMRPDAAAAQISAMDDVFAAQTLTRLEPRVASIILNEIAPAKAARIADRMAGRTSETQN